MKSLNAIPVAVALIGAGVTHCGQATKESLLNEDAVARIEYYIGSGQIFLPGNENAEEYEFVVVNKRTLDPKNHIIKMETTSSDDAANPCYLDTSAAKLQVLKDSITADSAKFVATKVIGISEELKNLSTRPEGQKHHGILEGKPWEWTKVESLILGEAEGEIHRLQFKDVNENGKLSMSMVYGLCFNASCTKSDEYNHEYTTKYSLKPVSQSEYDKKSSFLRDYKKNNPDKCPD